jgi:hypothetical protein
MADDPFKDQQKVRKAQIINPPNTIKKKVGTGGLDKAVIEKAEEKLETAIEHTDFAPIADDLLQHLDTALQAVKGTTTHTEAMVEALLHPAAQFKAQGTMYHYPLVTDMGDILINFLETVTLPLPPDAIELVIAHKKAITAVVHMKMKGADNPQGLALKKSLMEACDRYYKLRKAV